MIQDTLTQDTQTDPGHTACSLLWGLLLGTPHGQLHPQWRDPQWTDGPAPPLLHRGTAPCRSWCHTEQLPAHPGVTQNSSLQILVSHRSCSLLSLPRSSAALKTPRHCSEESCGENWPGHRKGTGQELQPPGEAVQNLSLPLLLLHGCTDPGWVSSTHPTARAAPEGAAGAPWPQEPGRGRAGDSWTRTGTHGPFPAKGHL